MLPSVETKAMVRMLVSPVLRTVTPDFAHPEAVFSLPIAAGFVPAAWLRWDRFRR
jgi:hypothetical protein